MNEELNNDVENILFHIKNNIVPIELDKIQYYYDVKHVFLKEASNVLFKQLEPAIKELVKQSYKEGFKQGQEFEKTQPNGFN